MGQSLGWEDWEERGGGEVPAFDTAVICENGHLINDRQHWDSSTTTKFCQECGAAAVHACRRCGTHIRGYDNRYAVSMGGPPAFCPDCGSPYPWTEARLAAAREVIADVEEFSEADRATFEDNVGDLVKDTPRTVVAARRVKALLAKAPGWAADSFQKIMVSVLTEAAKRQLFGPP